MLAASAFGAQVSEEVTVAAPLRPDPHRVYVLDTSPATATDARIHVVDGNDGALLGQIDAGYIPGVAIDAARRRTYVATTYFSRGSHGARTDVVEATDNATLAIERETVLQPKRAQVAPELYDVSLSEDGAWLYVVNATPSTSVSVIDTKASRLASEIDTDGCVLAYPSGQRQFTSLCESGKALTVTLDRSGKELSRELSHTWIDVANDPVFANPSPEHGRYWFLTFSGLVRQLDFAHRPPDLGPGFFLATRQEREALWRPGGWQPSAVHAGSRRLYVGMHRGREGSHKQAGTEIWVFDLKTGKRLARWNLADRALPAVISIAVSQDDHPLLYGLTEDSRLLAIDAFTGARKYVSRRLGQAALLLFAPGERHAA